MCYIAEGRSGACDRYGNSGGRIVRLDPLTILEHRAETGGAAVPFDSGESWNGELVDRRRFVTAIGAGTTYPDYKPAPVIVSQEVGLGTPPGDPAQLRFARLTAGANQILATMAGSVSHGSSTQALPSRRSSTTARIRSGLSEGRARMMRAPNRRPMPCGHEARRYPSSTCRTLTDRTLSRRERQIMDVIYRRGRATSAEVLEDLPDPPSYSSVRSALGNQFATCRTWSGVTLLPSQLRSTDSSTMRMDTGSRATFTPRAWPSAGSE